MLIAYFVGLVPSWWSAKGYASELEDLQRRSRLSSARISLADAAIDAERGDLEGARLHSSEFFTKARAELDRDDSLLSPPDRQRFELMLAKRGELMTMIARGDPAVADLLTSWYVELGKTEKPPPPALP